MSATANRTRGAVPTKMAAAIAALALLAVPAPGSADGSSRTVLLTLTDEVSLTQLSDSVHTLGGRVLQTLEIADSLLVELPVGVAVPVGAALVPDTPMKVNGTQTYYETTEPTYRETIGLTEDSSLGAGVKVALVDTGVADVPDLERVVHINTSGDRDGDRLGHGTFLAGLIAGDGRFRGVAPEATIVDIQVADRKGNTSLHRVLAGLDAAAENDVDVVNLSLSSQSPLPPSFDPLSRALDNLWDEGVTVVVAAGNDGPEWGTVGSPGNTPSLITVGALDERNTVDVSDDGVAEFSSRGSVVDRTKPDLIAPGVSLVSTAAPRSLAVKKNPESLVDGGYMRGSGTSMAAAVVSGAAAALLGEREALEPNGVKALLLGTTRDGGPTLDDGAGNGALDLSAALNGVDSADLNPEQADPEIVSDESGPAEADADAWAAFAEAWTAKDKAAARAAWSELAPRTRIWAARAWSTAVVANGLGLDAKDFKARAWSARAWSAEKWLARAWSARAWSARAWSDEEWLARAWSARAWSDEEWLARAWSARAWSDEDWAARAWSARAWSAMDWNARAWSAPRMVSPRMVSPRMVSPRMVSPRMVSPRMVSPRMVSPRMVSTRMVSPRMV